MGENQVTFKDWDHALAAVRQVLTRLFAERGT
jgi:hypothetical protein